MTGLATTPPRTAPRRSDLWAGGLLALLAVAGVGFLLRAQQALTGNLWGVPLDDAYIHFQFARNLATGHGFSFNPGQPVPGSTSPLWVVLLAIPAVAGAPLWLAAKAYGVIFMAASAVLAWRLALRIGMTWVPALAVGALTALDGRLLWAAPSGMEVTLFAALSLAAMLARPGDDAANDDRGGRVVLVAALCGLATLARPEGALLAVVLAIDLLVRRRRPRPLFVAASVALYVVLVAPYAAFALATTGHVLPTTFYAKASAIGPSTLPNAVVYVRDLLLFLLETNPAEAVFLLVGAPVLWQMRGAARAAVAWPLLLVVEQAILSPLLYHFGRYVMPLEPFFALWAVVGIGRLTRPSPGATAWRNALPSLALVLVGIFSLGLWASLYAYSVQNIDAVQVALGGWVRAHVPPGEPVAMHDVGAITYISGHPAVDIVGLVTPRFIALERERPAARAARDVYAELKRRGARYLIIFPSAYPNLARQPGLRRVYSVTVTHPVIEPAATMVVYRVT